MEVDQFLADQSLQAQRVRLHGMVSEQDYSVSKAGLTARFQLQGKTQMLPVVYRGTVPHMFQAGRNVVVEGKVDKAGIFQADILMTKCASKYEANSPHAKTEQPS